MLPAGWHSTPPWPYGLGLGLLALPLISERQAESWEAVRIRTGERLLTLTWNQCGLDFPGLLLPSYNLYLQTTN